MHPYLQNFVQRIRDNDTSLGCVSLQSLPLLELSPYDVNAVLAALRQNHVVQRLEFWFPENRPTGNSKHDVIDCEILHLVFAHLSSLLVVAVAHGGTDQVWQAMFAGLAANGTVQELQIGDSTMTDELPKMTLNVARGLQTMLVDSQNLHTLTLRGTELSVEAAYGLATGIRQAKMLKHVELHQIECDPASFAFIIQACRNLYTLHLIDSDLGLAHVRRCDENSSDDGGTSPWFALLTGKKSQLRCLRLLSVELGAHDLYQLASALADNTTLHVLDVRGNALDDTAGPALGELLAYNNSLVKLIVEDNALNDAALQDLCHGLSQNRSLRNLNLRGNHFGLSGCQTLAQALVTSRLVTLDVSENHLDSCSVVALAQGLAQCSHLHELLLENSHLDDRGLQALAKVLNTQSFLKVLDLSQNRITHTGSRLLGELLRANRALERLNLTACWIDNASLQHVFAGLRHNQTLISLELGFNIIGNDGCEHLLQTLPSTKLEALTLQFNTFDHEGIQHLRGAVRACPTLQHLSVLNASGFYGARDATAATAMLLAGLDHELQLNSAGRRALTERPALAVWPRVLERAATVYGATAVFVLLCELPEIALGNEL